MHHSPNRIAAAISAFAVIALLTAVPAIAELLYGNAQGALTVAGERHELTHSYALSEHSVFESRRGEEVATTVVVLSDRELDRALVGDPAKLARAARSTPFHAVQVRIQNDNGAVLDRRLYGPGEAMSGEWPGGEGSLWLRGEFTDKAIWGALGTDGPLPLSGETTWRFEAFFAATFPPPPSAALAENTAAGIFKLAGRPVQLAYARAYLDDRTVEGGEADTYTVVVLGSGPVDLATARNDNALAQAVKKSKLTALKLWVHDQSGEIRRQSWFSAKSTETEENPEHVRWAAWEFTPDKINGFVTSDGARKSGKTAWDYEVNFHAPIVRE